MEITTNYESPHKNYHLVESSSQNGYESSTNGDNNSDQETSIDETPRFVSSKSESEDNYIPRLFMANIKEEECFFEEKSPEETLVPEMTKPNGDPWFTFDDIPPSRWRKRLIEFGVWLDTQIMKTSVDRMAQRYYVLNGYNDPGLKNTYVSSLPQELQLEIHRMLAATQKDIKTMSLGQIHQVELKALEKLCIFHHQYLEETVLSLQDSSPDEASPSESEYDKYLPIYSIKEIGSSLPTSSLPCFEVHVLATKFSHPKKFIAYMDTRAQITMMNPSILPAESWVTHVAYFVEVGGKFFKTDLMTNEKIGIKFLPDCIIWTRVIDSNLPNIDIIVGMDVYSTSSRLEILLT
ncbi:hypothetical protein KIW84_023198 [Lathyrus oleraceus]|uniref:Polyprotein n=1 Tax=Pisum sativum TaxID=3888 RepID=A0A9D4YEY0_PEA|nr:hypothetical protein KIW84_023198 [Pisum sativum]